MQKILDDPAAVRDIAIDAIKKTVCETFRSFLGIEVEIGNCGEEQLESPLTQTLFGVIGLMGTWHGTGIVKCAPECAYALSNLLLGIENSSDDDAKDAVAEMSNVIFGGMKTLLEPAIGYIGMNTPTIMFGSEVSLRAPGGAFTTVPVQFLEHSVLVKLYLANQNDQPPASARRPGRLVAAL